MKTKQARSPHTLIREIERNVRAFIDGGKTRGDFDRRARVLWDEAALDPTVYADLSAYFAKVTLARGTLSEAHCGCACHRIPDSCPHSASQNMARASGASKERRT